MTILSSNSSTIIIDSGSSSTKFGLSTDSSPKIISTAIGSLRKNIRSSFDHNDFFIGQSAQKNRGILRLEYPIKKGIIENFIAIEKIWQHIFDKELSIDPSDHKMLLALPSKNQIETIEEILFETFQVPSVAFCDQAQLSLLSSGISTGLVVDIGEGLTQITPCYENEVINHAATNFAISGCDITEEFKKKLNVNGKFYCDEILKEMKEKCCYVRGKCEVDSISYELPDGQFIKIKSERSECAEILFKENIHKVIKNSILKCDKTIQKKLFENILMVGGGANIEGLKDRLEKEIKVCDVKCKSFPGGENAAWIGGSILASKNYFNQFLIDKLNYEEGGLKYF